MRQVVQTAWLVFSVPLGPFVVGVENNIRAVTAREKVLGRLKLMYDRTLIYKRQVKIKNIVADDQIGCFRQLPKTPHDVFFILSFQHFGRLIVYGIANAEYAPQSSVHGCSAQKIFIRAQSLVCALG